MHRFPFCGYCAFREPTRYASFRGTTISRCRHKGSAPPLIYATREVNTTVSTQNHWFSVKDEIYNRNFVSRTQDFGTLSDDFGVLFLDGSSNATSANGESNFLDRLLRFESASKIPDCVAVSVPTTIDQSEIGGVVEIGGLEQCLEGLLGDGYDVSAMLTDYQDSVTERQQGVAAVSCGSSSLHMNSVVSQMCTLSRFNVRLPRTRQFITDQMRKDSRNHNHCSISPVVPTTTMTSVDTKIKENVSAFFSLTEPEPSTSGRERLHEVNTTRSRFEPELGRTDRATLEEMDEVIQSKDVANLRALLQTKRWPLNYEEASNALMLAVEQSEDCEEASMFFRDFATSSPRSWVRDWVTVSLATRAAREHGAEEAKRLLESQRHIFMARAPAERHSDNRLSHAFKELFEVVAQNGNCKECEMLFNCARKLGYSVNESTFVDQVTNVFGNQNFPFPDFLRIWKDLSNRFLTIKGVDVLLEKALIESKDSKVQAKRVEDILAHCTSAEDPFSAIAELLCVFVKLNRMEEASALFSRVSISGRHFKGPLRRLQQKPESLVYVERLANLITRCMYGERRRERTKNSVQTTDRQTSMEKTLILSEHLQRVVDNFCGIGIRGKKKTKIQKERIKKYKINEEELHDLSGNIQTVWIDLAERNGDVAAFERLKLWCATNRVDIPDRILRKIKKI